jgi:hypothetical protein
VDSHHVKKIDINNLVGYVHIVRLDTTLPIVPNYLGHTTAHDNLFDC